MGIIVTSDSELAKEQRKWEQFPRYDSNGELLSPGNPYAYREYPRMLYKAHERPTGKIECLTTPPNPRWFKDQLDFQRAELDAETFNRECQFVVKNDAERANAESQGWRASPQEALAYLNGLKDDISRAAAEAAYAATKLSPKAQAEFEQATDSTEHHVVDVQPKKRKPWTRKAVTARAEA